MQDASNWISALARPHSIPIKKYIYDIIQDRYPKHEDLLDRIASALITKNDIEGFGRLIADVYEVAYLRCVAEHSKILEQLGHKAIIVPGRAVEEKPIFQEKSG